LVLGAASNKKTEKANTSAALRHVLRHMLAPTFLACTATAAMLVSSEYAAAQEQQVINKV
jgi:hypothetical protein